MNVSNAALQAAQRNAQGKEADTSAAMNNYKAAMFQTLLEEVLPRSERAFGKGIAGSVARSQLAGELSAVLARSVDLGFERGQSNASRQE